MPDERSHSRVSPRNETKVQPIVSSSVFIATLPYSIYSLMITSLIPFLKTGACDVFLFFPIWNLNVGGIGSVGTKARP